MAHILIAEDDPSIQDLIFHKFSAAGHQVSVASEGSQVVDLALETKPDAIVMDWMMPGATGIEVCKNLRQLATIKDTYVVMVSAMHQPDRRRMAYEAGVDDFVTKPFKVNSLLRGIETAITPTTAGAGPAGAGAGGGSAVGGGPGAELTYSQALARARSAEGPDCDAPADPARRTPTPAGVKVAGAKVAVILGDTTKGQEALTHALTSAGVEVTLKVTGTAELLAAMESYNPPVVIVGEASESEWKAAFEVLPQSAPGVKVLLYLRFGDRTRFGALPEFVRFVPRDDAKEMEAALHAAFESAA